jgi:electron transfer flavoprotein beta subunit
MDRVLVLVKQVPATENVKLDETGTLVRTSVEAVINPLDLYAVEEAIRLKEKADCGLRLIVLSMGPPQAAEAVREALSMGCDEGFLLCGREFAGSDTWATAYALSNAIRSLGGADLILCGERATDGETGQVGPMVGAMLDLPLLTYVSGIESVTKETLVARREVEGGHEVHRMGLPALLCVVKEINEPRLPTLAGKIRARRAAVPILSSSDIQADPKHLGLAGSFTRVVKVFYPTLARAGKKLSVQKDNLEVCLDEIENLLESAGVLGREGGT